MMKVIEAHYPIIKQTIKRAPTFVYSILDQLIEGTVYTDTENLQTLLFQTKSGIYFVAGDSIHTVLDDQLVCCFQQSIEQKKRFTLFSYSEQWNIKIEQLLNDQLRKLERYTFTFDESLYDSREEREVPNFEVMPITHHHIKNAQAFSYAYYDEYWDSTANFLENGFGYCLVLQEQIVSEAVSIFKSNDFAEIDIMTDSNFRGQGLAGRVAHIFIDHCLANQLKPCWDCDVSNTASMYLGTKLGFTTPQKYAIYTKK
jgi:RimJ/RimL family protein N-acetyltransferase